VLVGDGSTLAGGRSAKMLVEMRATGWWPEVLISIMGVITSTEVAHFPAGHQARRDGLTGRSTIQSPPPRIRLQAK